MKKILTSNITLIILSITAGILVGPYLNDGLLSAASFIKYLLGEVIKFLVPLIVLGFVAPSIANLRGNATKLLVTAFALAYASTVGGGLLSYLISEITIPWLNISTIITPAEKITTTLEQAIQLPPVLNVMSALFLSVCLGLGCLWTDSEAIRTALNQFQNIILQLVKRILVPILPLFVAANFCILSHNGAISQLHVFLWVILIVIAAHYLWLIILYGAATIYTGKNGWEVLKHYLPAYLMALGTMSSAATLATALECINKSKVVKKDISNFAVPLFSSIHLCGSVLTEVLFVCVVAKMLNGAIPPVESMIPFILLLGLIAVGAPGVPGGTMMASITLVSSMLDINETGQGLLLAIYALQDSFGTGCNILGDGALTLMLHKGKD